MKGVVFPLVAAGMLLGAGCKFGGFGVKVTVPGLEEVVLKGSGDGHFEDRWERRGS